MNNYLIEYNFEIVMVRSDANKEILSKVYNGLTDINDTKLFFRTLLDDLLINYKTEIIPEDEIVPILEARKYEVIVYEESYK